MLHIIFTTLLLARAAFAASQAASLISAANQLPAGTYRIRNVGTGQYLVGNQRDLYAGRGTPTKVYVAPHTNKQGRHTVMGVGQRGNTKCVSASWSYQQNANGQGSLYECQLGPLAKGNKRTTLRDDKQAFILISANGKVKRQEPYFSDEDIDYQSLDRYYANQDVDEFSEDAPSNKLFDKRDENSSQLDKRARRKKASKKKKVSKKKPAKRPSSSGGYGPFYIIATDHLDDQKPRALDADSVTAMGQRVMKLNPWRKGDKNQQWLFVR